MSVAFILKDALLFDLTKVRDDVCHFIDDHAGDVLDYEGLMEISRQCLVYILKVDTLETYETPVLEKAIELAEKSSYSKGNTTPTTTTTR